MAAPAQPVNEPAALDSFIAKWRARWPEWPVAEVFVPAGQREVVAAWFALLQELTDAAWGGEDPTPGIAKLAWWQEELLGWSLRRRRHPLGVALQRRDAPWQGLASALPALREMRTLPRDAASALVALRVFAEAAAAVEQALLAAPGDPVGGDEIAATLLATHPRWPAGATDAGQAAIDLNAHWPSRRGLLPRRIVAAMARARLGSGVPALSPLPPWRTLWLAWRAARH